MANPDPIPRETIAEVVQQFEQLLALELLDDPEPCSVPADVDGIDAQLARAVSSTHEGFGSLIVSSPNPPPLLDVNHGNLDVVGPSRWIVRDGRLAVRVDTPPGASRRLLRYAVRDALSLAGYPLPPLSPSWRARRLEQGRERFSSSMEALGVDPGELLRVAQGYVAAYDTELLRSANDNGHWFGGMVGPLVDGSTVPSGYCMLHLVRGRRGDALLRVSAFAGWVPRSVTVDYNDSEVQMARLVQVGRGAARSSVDPKALTVAVTDIDLLELTPDVLDRTVWAVATYAGFLRTEWPDWPDRSRRRSSEVVAMRYGALRGSPRTEPLEVVDPVLPVLHFVDDGTTLGDGEPPRSDAPPIDLDALGGLIDGLDPMIDEDPFDRDLFDEDDDDGRWDVDDEGDDEPVRARRGAHRRSRRGSGESTARGACGICGSPAEGSWCDECAGIIDEGYPEVLDLLRDHHRVDKRSYQQLRRDLATPEPSRRRQCEHRIGKLLADCAPRHDLTTVDFDLAEQRVAEAFGGIGPGYRAALDVLEGLRLHRAGHLPSWLLHGPPGAGKTLVAAVLAAALGLPVHVEQLGGAAGRQVFTGDEVLWTSSGPGVLAESIVRHRTLQLIVCLDELEKYAGVNNETTPWSALLSALDDQRANFTDRFLGSGAEWQLDLRHMVFIATANELHAVADPLKSRMIVIEVPAWTAEEKLVLAERELAERISEAGLQVRPASGVAQFLVDRRADPGVRELLSDIGRLVGWLARHESTTVDLEVQHLVEVFPPPRPTPVASRLPSRCHPGPGTVRTATLEPRGWVELRCSAVTDRRWGGHVELLGPDVDLLFRWATGLPGGVSPCLLHLEPLVAAPPWLALDMLTAAVSAATGLVPADDLAILAAADVQGRLLARTSSVKEPGMVDGTDVAGLRSLGFDRVVMAVRPDPTGPTWQRDDLPRVEVATTVHELLTLALPGFAEWRRRGAGHAGGSGGYL